jgi:hypothetical protein
MQYLFMMVLTIQICVYFPIYKVDLPPNLLIFLDSIRKIAEGKVVEPKELVKKYVVPVISTENTKPPILQDKYKSAGFDSFSLADNL